jgi:hypothetical protein
MEFEFSQHDFAILRIRPMPAGSIQNMRASLKKQSTVFPLKSQPSILSDNFQSLHPAGTGRKNTSRPIFSNRCGHNPPNDNGKRNSRPKYGVAE